VAELTAQARQPEWSWQAIVARAFAEDLAPLLYTQLAPTRLWLEIAPGVCDALATAYEGSAIRSAVLLTELAAVLDRLARAGVPVLLLKGAALAETLYGDPALRPLCDLDLLVHETAIGLASAVLTAGGYSMARPAARPGATRIWGNELLFSKPGLVGIQVELHWRVLDSPFGQQRLPLGWFWETATPVRVGHAAARTLGPEAALLYLCAHLTLHHRGAGLKWWLDPAELIWRHKKRLDWPGLLRQAEAGALVMPLQEALSTLVEMWGVRVPPDFLARLATVQPSPVAHRMMPA